MSAKCQLLSNQLVDNVELQGSMKDGSVDSYSDIDLQVNVRPYNDGYVFLDLPNIMAFAEPILFTHVYKHLPDKYVANIWSPTLTDGNIYLWVDIQVVSSPHNSHVFITHDPDSLDHLLRHYCQALKYTIRGAAIAKARRCQLLDKFGLQSKNDPAKDLRNALEAIQQIVNFQDNKSKSDICNTYIQGCQQELQRHFR